MTLMERLRAFLFRPLTAIAPERASLSASLSIGGVSFIGTAGISIVTSVLIARLYGIDVVGQFALAFAPTSAVWLLSTVREQPAFIRRAAVLQPRDPRLTGLFVAVFSFSSALTILVSGLAAVATYYLFRGPIDHPELYPPAMAGLGGYVVFTNTCVNLDSILVSFRAARELLWLRWHQSAVYLVLIVIGHAVSPDVWSLVLATAGSWCTPCIHRLALVRRWMAIRVPQAEIRAGFAALPEMVRFGLKLTPGGLAQGISDDAPTWILGSLASVAAVGAYNRAWMLTRRLLELNQRLTELLFPTLVERRSTGDRPAFDHALVDSLRYVTILMFLPAAAAGGAAESVMSVFGPGFTRASNAFPLLLLVPAMSAMVSVLLQGLLAFEQPTAVSVSLVTRLVVTVPAVLLLTHAAGITGAALGMVMGVAVQLACQLAMTRRHVTRSLTALWPKRQMAAVIGAYAIGFVAARAVELALPGYLGLVGLLAGTIAYCGAFVLLGGLLPRDRERLGFLRRRLFAGAAHADQGAA